MKKVSIVCAIRLLLWLKILYIKRMYLAKKLDLPDVLSTIENKEKIDNRNISIFARINEEEEKIRKVRLLCYIKRTDGQVFRFLVEKEERRFMEFLDRFQKSAHVVVMADGQMELYTGIEMGR